MFITKRDGTVVPFNREKIVHAINMAFIEVDGQVYEDDTSNEIADLIAENLKNYASVEEIQDQVEEYLMSSERQDVARAYIRYRYKKEVLRNNQDEFFASVGEKLAASNIQNQNANVDEASFGGRIGEASSVMTRKYALDFIVSKMARENHLSNRIYIHDLDNYAIGSHNCLSIPFDDLLAKGFNTRQTDVRPASSVNTAFQLVAVIFQLQSLQQFGGVSATHLDWTMVPYVRKSYAKHYRKGLKYLQDYEVDYSIDYMLTNAKDYSIYDPEYKAYNNKAHEYAMDLTEQELRQAVEGMYHNLNTLQSRSGNQLPFTSINYGTCTLPEGRMVTKALIEGSLAGVGKLHKTSIFPCGIFQCMKGVNRAPGDPNYDLYRLALKSTAHRLYPNYANVDWSGNAGYDINDPRTYFSTMGCRTANGWDVNGFGQLKDGRGNICPVTIIMPTLAMEAKEKVRDWAKMSNSREDEYDVVDEFMFILDKAIHDARDMLIERFDWICSQSPASAKFMYENGVMAGYVPEEGIRSALKHGTLVIGQLGLAETLQILIGTDHTTEEGMALAIKIESLFKQRCTEFKEKYSLNFGVYYSPAENLCHTALKKFRSKYGIIENVSDKEFFTNSMHVPVWYDINPIAKIDIESQLTGFSSAGCITYIELDCSARNNIDALETLVNYAMDKDIPYFAINTPNDTCLECGFCDEFNNTCPSCGSHNIQQLRRVTGYLTGNYTTAFNMGKQDEVKRRVKHK
jgi:ribonucleoside-triphosphate reductase